MTISPNTFAERSRQQSEMNRLLSNLNLHTMHEADIRDLGCTTEKEAYDAATLHLTTASAAEIVAAIQSIERTKLKTYDSVKVAGITQPPYAGITDSLSGITKAALSAFVDACKRTTFASGNKYQPLPTHDEAWQIYATIFQTRRIDQQISQRIRRPNLPVITDEEVQQAARWGFWDRMSTALRRRAYKLLPTDKQATIARQYKGNPTGAMDATRDYYDEHTS
jgi:hypothetical protein